MFEYVLDRHARIKLRKLRKNKEPFRRKHFSNDFMLNWFGIVVFLASVNGVCSSKTTYHYK